MARKNTRSNLKIVYLLLFVSAFICLCLSVFLKMEQSALVFRRVGLIVLAGMIIQTVLFKMPDGNKPQQKKTK